MVCLVPVRWLIVRECTSFLDGIDRHALFAVAARFFSSCICEHLTARLRHISRYRVVSRVE